MSELTRDAFFNGRISILQEKNGYRFSIDAVLLAGMVKPRPGDTIVDLGTGCGVIPLLIACRASESANNLKIHGIEIQASFAEIATRNAADNRLENIIEIIQKDLKDIKQSDLGGPVDTVVSNPPYWKAGTGRVSSDTEKSIARHDFNASLADVVAAARRLLKTGGRLHIIYPSDRLVDVVTQMRQNQIEPKTLCHVHSRQGEDAKLFIIQGTMNAKPGLIVKPPLTIYSGTEYTTQAESFFKI